MSRRPSEQDWAAAVAAVRTGLRPGARVLLVCHVNPDGDALGSMLGFAQGLRQLGVESLQCTFPGPLTVPAPLHMPAMDLLVPESEADPAPDLLVTFDAASEGRLGSLVDRLETAAASVVLDHHASNTGFGKVSLVDPFAAATSVVAAELLRRLGVVLDRGIAECLYIALVTDTGSFKFDLTTPEVHELAARLVATGIGVGEVSRRIFDTRPFGAIRLFGEVLGRAELDPAAAGGRGLVIAVATLDDLAKHDQPPYVLEALIDSVRCTAEADVALLLKQVAPAEWAVSMRSKGGADVSLIAVALGGGGHRLAAGFTGHGTAADVIAAVRECLAEQD
ncbi:bifunctional oligoribonuclease/PAP phosphatase NrnA [Catellatospora sp. KI3]|uniref:DHH family phosphoesterase n=1 Tax=Catellatospora sp. KI3 TaxID=3041620 RepID=UPI0024822C95|nr:bifunctional oligoribonuclease/PAP phosphatase NrnA [Catellatospora sp. KI3]MDI1459420.1 bifunctional oligoribonuclease/PAP phosphatase NrnA [Catellatospora sp. KI3]